MSRKSLRNEDKHVYRKQARKVEVDAQIKAHNTNVSLRATREIFLGQIVKKNPPMPDNGIEFLKQESENYRKVDPHRFYIDAIAELDEVTGKTLFRGCIMQWTPDGPAPLRRLKFCHVSIELALSYMGHSYACIGVKNKDGITYPYYNEARGRIMSQAQKKREIRKEKQLKALKQPEEVQENGPVS